MILDRLPLPILVAAAAAGIVGWTGLGPVMHWSDRSADAAANRPQLIDNLYAAVHQLDQEFARQWDSRAMTAAAAADELQVLRRVSLAFFGTIPSLEEIRQFEADREPNRLERWVRRMLTDPRWGMNVAERLGAALVGDLENDHPSYRRERFINWLGEELNRGRPYDELVREIIAETGSPTMRPATNFVTAEVTRDEQFANRLTSRTVRVFLGQRIDCAECHDHPFEAWKKLDFEGLAAYFAQLRLGSIGLVDDSNRQFEVEDRETLAKRVVEPRVPFHDDWAKQTGRRRQQLADWLTHRENRRFRRAIANRVWALMFGRPFVTPVDDIPDPPDPSKPDETAVLDLLGADLQSHGYDLRRIMLVIALSKPFLLASMRATPVDAGPDSVSTKDRSEDARDGDESDTLSDSHWSAFPLMQLRPEQLNRSMQQAALLQPIHDRTAIGRGFRMLHEQRFCDEYGHLGEREFESRAASVPQIVVHMTGRFTREALAAKPMTAAGRIAAMARSDSDCLDACFLVCLTRRPTQEERAHFLAQLSGSRGNRARAVEDIFWALLNSPEFVWNH